MEKEPIALFGIPVANKTLTEVITYLEVLIEEYQKDLTPKYLSTFNIETIHSVTSIISSTPKNDELLYIMRKSEGMLVHDNLLRALSWVLGSSIKESIHEEELFSLFVESMFKKKQSLFLLGGDEKTLKLCMLYLQVQYPGLRIVGAVHPYISTEGEALENAQERDNLLLEELNKARPDVLFLNLGTPKQEIWFERVRNKIHVPLTIGVKNAFEQMTDSYAKSPWIVQKWQVYFKHQTKALNYLYSLLNFPPLAAPLIANHTLSNALYTLTPKKWLTKESPSFLFLSSHHALAVKVLPSLLDAYAVEKIYKEIPELLSQETLIIDFQKVKHIKLEGFALLIAIWKEAAKGKKKLFALHISPLLKWNLQSHRIFDIVELYTFKSIEEILANINSGDPFYYAISQNHQKVVLQLLGRIDQSQNFNEHLKKFIPIIQEKECSINLTYVTYIDNAGLSFLLDLKKMTGAKRITFRGFSKEIKRTLRLHKVYSLLT